MSTNKMREALEALLAKPSDDLNDATEDADGYFRTPYRRAEIAAHEALADDEAERGTMREEFEAWWAREGATMCIGSSQAIARIAWQASRAAAPQSVEPVCFTSQAWLDEPIPSPKVVSATRRDGFDIPLYLAPPIAPTRPAQVEEWMPIETAPTGKEHSPPLHAIVASFLDDGTHYVEEAWFDNVRREWWPANVEYTDAHGSAIYPTHWRPLPAPPTKTKEQP